MRDPQKPSLQWICEVRDVRDEQGRRIEVVDIIHGTPPEDFQRFFGYCRLAVNTPQGKQIIDLRFALPAEDLTEAYRIYAEHAQAAARRQLDEMAGPKLLVPGMQRIANGKR